MDTSEPRAQAGPSAPKHPVSSHAESPVVHGEQCQEPTNKRTCAHCAHAGWLTTRWPAQLLCVNSVETPGKIIEVVAPRGACRNFHARREPVVRLPEPEPPNDKVRYIALTKGMFAIVDAEDYSRLMRHKWTAVRMGSKFYAQRNGGGHSIMMHREIKHAPRGKVVDHINGNSLDNRKCNLRICNQSQNILNSRPRSVTSRFKGVYYDKTRNKYMAFVWENGKCVMLGRFADEIEAARIRDYRAVRNGGPYVWLNFPDEWPAERIKEVYKQAQAERRRAAGRKPNRSTTKSTKKTRKRSTRN